MPTHQTDRHAPSRSTADCGLRTRTLGNLLPAALTLVLLSAAPARAQTTRTVRELMAAGDTAWTARQQGAARAAYAEVVRRDSSYSRAFYRLATLLAWKNSLDEALALYRLYTRLEPRDAEGPLAVARTLAWASRYGEAIATYDSLLARDRGLQGAALGRARTLAWSGNLREATTRYEEWLREHPRDADAWCGLAAVLHWSGHTRVAREALRRALEIQPTHAEPRGQRWRRCQVGFDGAPRGRARVRAARTRRRGGRRHLPRAVRRDGGAHFRRADDDERRRRRRLDTAGAAVARRWAEPCVNHRRDGRKHASRGLGRLQVDAASRDLVGARRTNIRVRKRSVRRLLRAEALSPARGERAHVARPRVRLGGRGRGGRRPAVDHVLRRGDERPPRFARDYCADL